MGHDGVSPVVLWRGLLGTVSVFNLCIWILVAAALASRRIGAPELERTPGARWQLLLSGIFVIGCGFRSLFPRADVQRIVLQDGWFSSVFVGRSVATVAELALVAQYALLFYQAGRSTGQRPLRVIGRVLVPLIVVAEACSWYAVLTTNYLGNAIEDSIWALAAGLAAAAFALLRARAGDRRRRLLFGSAAVACLVYVAFNGSVDVPNYVHRWLQDQHDGRTYLSLAAGLRDSAERWVVTHEWGAWRDEIPWMSLYFSIGVWVSLGLARFSGVAQGMERPARLPGLSQRLTFVPGTSATNRGAP